MMLNDDVSAALWGKTKEAQTDILWKDRQGALNKPDKQNVGLTPEISVADSNPTV